MGKQQKYVPCWRLVKVSDLPVPSRDELEILRGRWMDKLIWFYVGAGRWRQGKVYAITERGEVKIAVRRGDVWVHGCVKRFEYIPRVLRLASGG